MNIHLVEFKIFEAHVCRLTLASPNIRGSFRVITGKLFTDKAYNKVKLIHLLYKISYDANSIILIGYEAIRSNHNP